MERTNTIEPAQRTPVVIAGEIVAIKEQAGKILLISAIEIGRRLAEARAIIPYGEFAAWLKSAVDYSESTAYNYMRLAEEYGPALAASSPAGTQAGQFANLSYTKAVILLGIPAEERQELLAGIDIDNMAVRQLQEAVNEKKHALTENEGLRQELEGQMQIIDKLTEELDQANKTAEERQQTIWDEQGNSTILKRELEVLTKESAAARRIAQIEQERKVAKLNLAMAEANAHYELIIKGFDNLLTALRNMGEENPKALVFFLKELNKYIGKVTNKLIRIEKEAAQKAAQSAAAWETVETTQSAERAEATETTEIIEITKAAENPSVPSAPEKSGD
jgi:hypothetical protein